MAPRKPKPTAPGMPHDTCGDCYFQHKESRNLDWCFADPPYPVETADGAPASTRGTLTDVAAPCCNLFKPKKVH